MTAVHLSVVSSHSLPDCRHLREGGMRVAVRAGELGGAVRRVAAQLTSSIKQWRQLVKTKTWLNR